MCCVDCSLVPVTAIVKLVVWFQPHFVEGCLGVWPGGKCVAWLAVCRRSHAVLPSGKSVMVAYMHMCSMFIATLKCLQCSLTNCSTAAMVS
jgi:hypothetical protein